MFGTALDLTIGLVLIYFLFSLVTSGVNEVIASRLQLRAKYLEAGIVKLLGQPLAEQFFEHPSVKALSGNGGWFWPWQKPEPDTPDTARKPSYIPSNTFATTVLSIVAGLTVTGGPATGTEPTSKETRDNLVTWLHNMTTTESINKDLGKTLQLLYTEAGDDLNGFLQGIEKWFDGSMDRVSGWYKRNAKRVMLVIGLAVAVAANVDTLSVANVLWNNGPVRAGVVAQAQNVVANFSPAPAGATGSTSSTGTDSSRAPCPTPLTSPSTGATPAPPGDSVACVVQQIEAVQQLHLPIGWSDEAGVPRFPKDTGGRVLKIIGWLLTAVALSFGAPFWFQLLGKLVNLRSSGPTPTPSGGAPTRTTSALPASRGSGS